VADEELPQEEKKGGKLKWIIIVVLLLALGAGGYFAYMKFMAPEEPAAEETASEQSSAETPQEGILKPLPVFLVNLADPLGRRYLKLGVEVEVRDEKVLEELETNQAKIKDSMLLLLSSKTYGELSTLQDKIELKNQIADRLNQVLGNGSVLRVYITEMVIQ
jgi:flagellar FliL protein